MLSGRAQNDRKWAAFGRARERLAGALADTLNVEPSAVQVLTSIVPSGAVVEAGETLRW